MQQKYASSQLVALLSLNRLFELEIFPIQKGTFRDALAKMARDRVREHFKEMTKESDFGLEAKWKCTRKILSPVILGAITDIDLIGVLLQDQITIILEILKEMGAGEPQNGPFPPIVLLQPKNLKNHRFQISSNIRFCFSLLEVSGILF